MSDLPSEGRPHAGAGIDNRPRGQGGPTGSAEASLDRIWNRIRRPVDPHGAIEALVGVPRRTARQVIGAATAGSDEATALLSAMPQLIRNLSISTISVPERCAGEIRGPILWSETMAARSSSAGDPGVFVCSTVSRAHDTPENRLLVAALGAIVRGGRDVEQFLSDDDDELAQASLLVDARRHADLAQRFLDHRTLIDVQSGRSTRRSQRRVRHDPRRRAYRPVAAMLARAAEPLDVSTIRLFCNAVTTARHDLFVAAIDHLEARGVRVPALLVVDREVVGGPVRFHHPALATRSETSRYGLFVGATRLDVPGGLPSHDGTTIVRNRGDLTSAIDAAITRDGL
ncbi:hypothetical protein [Actinospongicola halichondriae]|uniref:hypothetical protein n=1 Tax=Actinospongicola halichondriae TaxID=3236844 RepID=UPI003D491F4B